MNELPQPTQNNFSIGKGVTFDGSIECSGQAVIDGEFSGNLVVENLLVGESGNVKGKIQSRNVQVKGKLTDEITCIGLVSVESTGTVTGTLLYGEIEIEQGGVFDGSMSKLNA